MLNNKSFKIVIDSTPPVSTDLLVNKDNNVSLDKRINKPA